jgi:predicted outer membrane repeat protein
VFTVIAVALTSNTAFAQDIQVPQDYATIQEAIDAATEGNSILVGPGEYPEAIDFGTKNLVLESSDGPETTIIGRYGTEISIVTIGGGQTLDTVVRGFTIWRGYRGTPVPGNPSSLVGGGIFVNDSSPLIENCIFTDNKSAFGSGIYYYYGGGEVRNCQFVENFATSNGGGAQTFISDVQFVDCTFDDNFAVGEGGGIKIVLGTTDLSDCTFTNNVSNGDGGAVFWFANKASDPMDIVGCSITGNSVASDARGAGIYARPGFAPVRLTDSVVCTNEADEIYGPYEDVSGNVICICPGDLTGDGQVGGPDLGILLALWGECIELPCEADFNGDGFVNGIDLGMLLSYWGNCKKP